MQFTCLAYRINMDLEAFLNIEKKPIVIKLISYLPPKMIIVIIIWINYSTRDTSKVLRDFIMNNKLIYKRIKLNRILSEVKSLRLQILPPIDSKYIFICKQIITMDRMALKLEEKNIITCAMLTTLF